MTAHHGELPTRDEQMTPMWTLRASAQQVGGRLTGADTTSLGVVTDSRGDCRGRLFGALRGERFDGHDPVARVKGMSEATLSRAGKTRAVAVCAPVHGEAR